MSIRISQIVVTIIMYEKVDFNSVADVPLSFILCVLYQVKNVYIRLLYTCYVDCGLDNKETFAKDHMWTLFNSTLTDITKVLLYLHTYNTPTYTPTSPYV